MLRLLAIGMVALASIGAPALQAQDAVNLAERLPSGYEYRVQTRVDLTGDLQVPVDKNKPPQKVKMTGRSTIDYDERVLAADGKTAEQKTIRQYRNIDFRRTVGDRPQQIGLRSDVRRLVVMKNGRAKVPFSPDGPLTWNEIDMLRTDIFIPELAGLLPGRAVKPGDTWTVRESTIIELTDLEKIEKGTLTAKFETEENIGGRKVAHITLSGDLSGINEDGPNRQKISGRMYFDLKGEFISYLSINGESLMLDKDGVTTGHMSGEYVMVRRIMPRNEQLTDAALAKITTEPNADNTLLLYEEPDLGVKLLHPRRWRVGRVARGQITLDEANGSGLLITVEPLKRVPTAEEYLREAQGFLTNQKAKISRLSQPTRLQNPPDEVEQFHFNALLNEQHVVMDYLIVRQPNAGATFAARILENDRDALMKEVERMARTLTLSRKLEGN
jgi:hypothetical protein